MKRIEPHIHMATRTTDDYQAMALAGFEVVVEPAFWAGYDRATAKGFADYYHQLTVAEPARAAIYGLKHYCWICLNPKEAEDLALARDVLEIIPQYLDHPRALGVGEIGLNKNSRNELQVLERHVELAAQRGEMILVHTPHLEDKRKGTLLIMDAICNQGSIDRGRVIIDHAEEQTIGEIKDRGFWVGLTLYPTTKCTPARAVDLIECYGADKTMLASSADWGPSDPLATVKAGNEMLRRGHPRELVEKVLSHNPQEFLSQSPKFKV